MKKLIILLVISFSLLTCRNSIDTKSQAKSKHKSDSEITCTDRNCEGTYVGPEFTNGSDVAHQFSNKMSGKVGNRLKELYRNHQYSKVDFSNILMTTAGMGSGNVTYFLSIPFKEVENNCDAYTSFDHVGGWNHKPALQSRKSELRKLLLPDGELDISELKTTKEGLQEYWIQWKHREVQRECFFGKE